MPMIFCPTCESMLEIDSGSIGSMVECGSCKAQFTAKLPQEAAKPKREDDDDDTWKSKRPSRRDDDDDDRKDDPLNEDFQSTATPGAGLALASMILGIVGAVASLLACLSPCCSGVFVICDILAIIFGAITLKSEHRSKALPGLLLGIAGIVLKVILTVLVFVFMFAIR